MNTYVIRRKGNWSNPKDLEETAEVSARVGDEEMPDRVRWIRSYVVEEPDGRLGTVCIYQGTDVEAVREHARRVGMSADEVTTVRDTVVIREDPELRETKA
jgi:Nickel responsive protein SCO4226-like